MLPRMRPSVAMPASPGTPPHLYSHRTSDTPDNEPQTCQIIAVPTRMGTNIPTALHACRECSPKKRIHLQRTSPGQGLESPQYQPQQADLELQPLKQMTRARFGCVFEYPLHFPFPNLLRVLCAGEKMAPSELFLPALHYISLMFQT